MKKATWKKRIKDACLEAGTYEPFFDLAIDQLSQILEARDDAKEAYAKLGGMPVVKHTNKGGFTNLRKNPALAVIQECNQQALAYWKELGLTSKSYNAMGNKIDKNESDAFSELLSGIL